MAITLDLTAEQEAQLQKHAHAKGSDINSYFQKLVATELSPQHDGKMLLEYKIGDSISGEAITAIDFIHPLFLIFRNRVGDIGYVIKDRVKSDRAQIEFQRWRQKVDLELQGVFREQTNRLLASCLASYLLDDKVGDGEVEAFFEPLAKFIREQNSVEYVYGRDSDWIVYLSNKVVSYEYSKLPGSLVETMIKFHRLWHISRLLGEEDKTQVNSIFGSELTWLFRSGQSSAATSFNSSAEFLDDRKGAPARSYYILCSVASSFVLLSMVGLVRYVLERYGIRSSFILSGCVGGTIGATISIIQRGVTLTVNPFLDKIHLVFQGLVRVFLGMIFGGLVVVASNANITMGMLKDNVWSLFIFSIVAGFQRKVHS